MTAAIPIPPRMLVLLGVATAALLALLVARPLLLGDDETTTKAPVTPAVSTPSTPAPTPAKPVTPAKPEIQLVDGLPARIASKLRQSRVVVVAVYSGTSEGDRAAVGEARRGARSVGANFAVMNVLDEKRARELQAFVGDVSAPTVLVVRRPGKVVSRFEGMADAAVVAQAAHNAGARGK